MTRKLSRNYSRSARARGPLKIFDGGPRFGSTKLATAVIRCALILAVLSALLLIAARPAQAQTEKVLYTFTGGVDGGQPYAGVIFDSAGNLYGVTQYGGAYGQGTVFQWSAPLD